MQTQNMLPINAFYITWLRDKGNKNRKEAKRIDKKTGEIVSSKTKMDATDFIIYIMLLSRADKDNLTCYPSIETICKDSFITDRRTVWNHLQDLEQMEFIQIKKKRGKPNTYFMADFARWKLKPGY